MKQKKLALTLAAAIMLSLVSDLPPLTTTITAAAEEATTGKTEETKGLTAPQNVRVENGFLKWDEVEGAYGYMVAATKNNNEFYHGTYYLTEVELNRFFYDRRMDFGKYEFTVCTFDEANNYSECSEPVTASYVSDPNIEAPANVRLSEDGTDIIWDEVNGTKQYNVRFKTGDNGWSWTSISSASLWYKSYCGESGDYLFSVQAMDGDYNVSEWTEPITITYTAPEYLEAPKNVRLDDSGENILWDAVDGAESYQVCLTSSLMNGADSTSVWLDTTEAQYSNWKSAVCPYTDGEIRISVHAYSEAGQWGFYSDDIIVTYNPVRDESIVLPEEILNKDGFLRWEDNIIEDAWYWWCILAYGEAISFTECNSRYIMDSIIYSINNNKFPAGRYDVELYVVGQNNKYNYKTYTYTSEAVHDESVWIPEMFYKFDTLLWDYDWLRHDKTESFWLRFKQGDTVVGLTNNYSNNEFYGLLDLEDGDYTVEICVYEYTDRLGAWSEPLLITKRGDSLFDKENEVTETVEAPPEAADVPEEDRITSITINPAFNMKDKHDNNVELDLSKIKIKAKEIYDEEGLKRASEALGEELKGNKHYNLLDLTLLYNGADYSNGYEGLVQVIIPLPKGHRDKTFSCYRLTEVDGKMVKEIIEGEQTEDSYIIYLEHFSEYALIGAGEDEDDDTVTTTPAADFYKINLKTDGHGNASANVEDLAEVEAGTEVTLTATPNSGYKFSKWTVVNGGVTISNNKFTMPENDVEIKAEFTKTSSGGSGGSYGGSYRPSSSSSTTETVTVNGKTGTWSDVTSAIEAAANGATITVSGSTYVPADVIAAAAKKNVKLEIRANDTFTWVLDAAKMGEGSKTLSVSDVVVNAVNKTIRSSEASKNFRVTESGLGTGSSLRYNAGKENSGRFANLFRVNGSALEFVTSVKVDAAGNALLPITAAGAYKIVISDETKLVGDLDNSMGLSALDAAMMLKKLVNRDISDDETAKFDYNGDGRADAIDAAAVLKWCVNH